MALPGGPWDLQEAITEQRTATRTSTTPLTLHLEKAPASSGATTKSTSQRELRQRARLNKKPASEAAVASHSLRILQGVDVVKTIDITKLLAGDHEIRLVPPTRATLLYSDPDQPSVSRTFSRLHSQIDSQEGSQTGSPNKRNCFLKLCFHSLSDLKAASQAFLRLGLRCKTQFKTPNRSLSRIPSMPPVSGSSQPEPPSARSPYSEYGAPSPTPSQQYGGESSYFARPSPQPPTQSSADFTRLDPPYSTAGNVSKRAYTESTHGYDNAFKRRRSVAMHDEAMPTLAQRQSLPVDRMTSPWPTTGNQYEERAGSRQPGSRLPSMSPSVSRLGSIPPERSSIPRAEQDIPRVPSVETPERPPPRRELPASIQRHISRTPSQVNGGETRAPHLPSRASTTQPESTPVEKPRMAETDVQTEEPFIEPHVAFFAGMELFQDLSSLKDQMLKDCMDATRRLGEGGFVEEEARLVACYAIEFRARFLESCSQKAELFSQGLL